MKILTLIVVGLNQVVGGRIKNAHFMVGEACVESEKFNVNLLDVELFAN